MTRTKDNLIFFFSIIALLLILARVTSWFVDFDQQWDDLIISAVFCLIGIAFALDPKSYTQQNYRQWITRICGAYLIYWTFSTQNDWLTGIGIIAIILPRIFQKLEKRKSKKEKLNTAN